MTSIIDNDVGQIRVARVNGKEVEIEFTASELDKTTRDIVLKRIAGSQSNRVVCLKSGKRGSHYFMVIKLP